jgi:hypothetical protein
MAVRKSTEAVKAEVLKYFGIKIVDVCCGNYEG